MDQGQIDGFVRQLQTDFQTADLSAGDREMLAYAARLTSAPQSISETDIGRLRAVGFDDRGIHDIVCCVSYFAFVNRIADGLGVELE